MKANNVRNQLQVKTDEKCVQTNKHRTQKKCLSIYAMFLFILTSV